MQLYNGVTVRARPYSASERIDQIQTINMRAQAAQPPPPSSPAERGGK
jgi:hypothetical protein